MAANRSAMIALAVDPQAGAQYAPAVAPWPAIDFHQEA
jgi:hypothetical protein